MLGYFFCVLIFFCFAVCVGGPRPSAFIGTLAFAIIFIVPYGIGYAVFHTPNESWCTVEQGPDC